MPAIEFDAIAGLDRKSSETDLSKEFATKLANLSTTKKPGALAKDGAYTDVSTSLVGADLPASLTRKSLAEIGLTLPSDTDIHITHVQNASSENLVFVGKYWDGSSAFVADWLELTEHEGPYTLEADDITAGTNASTIVIDSGHPDFSDLSSVNDFYNGWTVVVDIAAGEKQGAVVIDYAVATDKTFTLSTGAITSVAAADTFTLGRYAIMADGIGESSSGSPPRYGHITNVDDVIRFLTRENAVVGMTGNAEQFPTQYQLHYGYVNRKFGSTGGAGSDSFNDFWFDVEQLLKPNIDSTGSRGAMSTIVTNSGGSLDVGVWEITFAYEYDGTQIGPLSDPLTVTTTSGPDFREIDLGLRIPYTGGYDSSVMEYVSAYDLSDVPDGFYAPFMISRRCTGVYVFAKGPNDSIGLLVDVLNSAAGVANPVPFASADDADNNLVRQASGFLSLIVDFNTAPAGSSYITLVGQTNLRPNFKYGTAIGSHFIPAAVRNVTSDVKSTLVPSVAAKVRLAPSDPPSPPVIPAPFVIDAT